MRTPFTRKGGQALTRLVDGVEIHPEISKGAGRICIFVTGGAGYIGSVLVPTLLERGHKVTVLDNFARGTTELAACCRYTGFNPVRGDARDERLLDELLPKADAVIPLAALVGAPLCKEDPITARTLNQDAVVALAKLVSKGQMLVYPTTNSGYGVGEAGKFCTEETPLKPISLYGVTKVEAERAVLERGQGYRCGSPRCSACRRAFASTCWSTTSPGAP